MAEPEWISIEDRLPKSGVPVLAFFRNRLGNRRIVRAQFAAANSLPVGDDADDDQGTYDEATDTYYCAEGWYEDNEYEETHWRVSDEVTHWMPLPSPPDAPARPSLDVQAVAERARRASPAPWRVDYDSRENGADQIVDANGLTVAFMSTPAEEHGDDAELIVALRNLAARALADRTEGDK